MTYQAVLFDMDGVVVDTHQSVTRFWLELADHDMVGEARMRGLMGAIELVPPGRKDSLESLLEALGRELGLERVTAP